MAERSADREMRDAAVRADTGGLCVTVLRTLDELRSVEDAWTDLARKASEPYAMPAWMWAWWRHAAPRSSRLRTVVVSSCDEVVGIAPLFVEYSLGVNRYRILGAGVSSIVGFLDCAGMEQEVAEALADSLREYTPISDAIS